MITSGVKFEKKKSSKNDFNTGEVSEKILEIPFFQK